MKPLFQTLKQNHYSSSYQQGERVSEEDLFSEMGIDFQALKKQNALYANTCAARMSLALLKSGTPISGRLKIKAGKYKDRYIEPGAKLLADQISKPTMLGKPEVYSSNEFLSKVKNRKGVVLFRKVSGGSADHIDLIEPINSMQVCHSSCYFQSKEIWFWELK